MWFALIDTQAASGSASTDACAHATCAARLSATSRGVRSRSVVLRRVDGHRAGLRVREQVGEEQGLAAPDPAFGSDARRQLGSHLLHPLRAERAARAGPLAERDQVGLLLRRQETRGRQKARRVPGERVLADLDAQGARLEAALRIENLAVVDPPAKLHRRTILARAAAPNPAGTPG
jgi:hypothetical protein